jgi:hypothetical protein
MYLQQIPNESNEMEENQIFYIKLENALPVGNPFLLDNLKQCGINPEGSLDWAQYFPISSPIPTVKRTEVLEQLRNFDGKTVREYWYIRNMTDEELAALPSNPLDTIPGNIPNVI